MVRESDPADSDSDTMRDGLGAGGYEVDFGRGR